MGQACPGLFDWILGSGNIATWYTIYATHSERRARAGPFKYEALAPLSLAPLDFFPRELRLASSDEMEISEIRRTVYVGTFIYSTSLTKLEVLENAAVIVGVDKGTILAIEKTVTEETVGLWEGEVGTKIVRAGEGQFFFPGFIGIISFQLG